MFFPAETDRLADTLAGAGRGLLQVTRIASEKGMVWWGRPQAAAVAALGRVALRLGDLALSHDGVVALARDHAVRNHDCPLPRPGKKRGGEERGGQERREK